MTFTTELAKNSSARFSLVKLRGARNVTSLVSVAASNTYTYTFPYQIWDVTLNGSSGTKVTDTPNSNGEWGYDDATKVLTVYSTTAPSSAFYFIAHFNMFFTNGGSNLTTTTGSDSTASVIYDNRLLSAPSMSQNASNNLTGLVSVSVTGINIANHDNLIQSYLTVNDSFYNKEVRIWVSVNDEVSPLITGVIVGLSLDPNGNQARFKLTDKLGLSLSKSPDFGDAFSEAFMFDGSTYTNIRDEHRGFAVPIVYGKESSAKWLGGVRNLTSFRDIMATLSSSTQLEAKFYDDKWAVCRIPNGESLYSNNMSLSDSGRTVLDNSVNCTMVTFTLSTAQSYADVQVGDAVTFSVSGASASTDAAGKLNVGNPYHGVIIRVLGGATTATQVTMLCDHSNGTSIGAISNFDIVAAPTIVYLMGGSSYVAINGYHYTTTVSSLTNNELITIALNTNAKSRAIKINDVTSQDFLLTADTGLSVNDGASSVHGLVRVLSQQGAKHETYLEDLISGSGITVNAASFTAAGTALSSRVFAQVPSGGGSDVEEISKYVQDVLKSTGGILFYKPDTDELHYKILDTLSAGTYTVTEGKIISGSFNTDIKYRDIRSKVISNNKGFPNMVPVTGIETGELINRSDLSEYLHGTNKSVSIKHILEDFTNDNRDDDILALYASPVVEYSFSMFVSALEFDIGDTIILELVGLVGGDLTQNCIVLGYKRNQDVTSVTCSPLRSL